MSNKKSFGETGFGKFLKKAGTVLPDVADIALKAVTGNISGAISDAGDLLRTKAATDAKAKELLLELERERMTWELEMERVHAADRASARSREVEVARTGRREWIPGVLAMVAVVAFSFALVVVAFFHVPDANREMFIHLLGIIEGSMLVAVYSYYFGSSRGSARKTDMMAGK